MKRPRGTINATGDNTEETTIDLRGLPALRTRIAPSRLQVGATLATECTDPLAEIGIRNLWANPRSRQNRLPPGQSQAVAASPHAILSIDAMAACGPTLPTWATRQAGSYLRYTVVMPM